MRVVLLILLSGVAFAQSYPAANTSKIVTPPNEPPVWNPVECGFIEGVADSCALPVTDPDADTLTITGPTGCSFPTGITLDDPNDELDYNGIGSADSSSGCVLTADDGINSTVDSAAFSIEITAQGGFAANSPSYTPLVRGAAGFGMDVANWSSSGYAFYEVDSLGTGSGTGTFRDAVEGSWSGCRIVYFSTSGVIDYALGTAINVTDSCLYIAGQTAPLPGILLDGPRLILRNSNIYVGHITIAQKLPLTESACRTQSDNIRIVDPASNIVIHNVMTMLSCDENIAVTGGSGASDISFYQVITAWPLLDALPTTTFGFNSIFDEGATRVLVARSLMANSQHRNPKYTEGASGSVVDNVIYNHGKSATDISSESTVNVEGNVYITGPDQVNNEGLRVADADSSGEIFWDISGTGMNRGIGMPDPPNINYHEVGFPLEASRIASVYPTGLTVNCAATNTAEEQECVRRVLDCAGPFPDSPMAFVTTLKDQVLTFGTGGEMVSEPADLPFTWPPTVAENTDGHGDLPGDPDAAGSPINAGVEWIMDHSDDLMPAGAGCN